MDIQLRPVTEADVPTFFAQQQDPAGTQMAAFVARDSADWDAFAAKWARILSEATSTSRTILVAGQVAGNVMCHAWFGPPEVCYWLGREYWGQGIATRALLALLAEVPLRPLCAHVAKDNLASIRVLQKCGFTIVGADREYSHVRGAEVEKFILELGIIPFRPGP